MAVAPQQFRPYYVGWLVAVLIILICVLGLIGVVPGEAKKFFALIGGLALALFFR